MAAASPSRACSHPTRASKGCCKRVLRSLPITLQRRWKLPNVIIPWQYACLSRIKSRLTCTAASCKYTSLRSPVCCTSPKLLLYQRNMLHIRPPGAVHGCRCAATQLRCRRPGRRPAMPLQWVRITRRSCHPLPGAAALPPPGPAPALQATEPEKMGAVSPAVCWAAAASLLRVPHMERPAGSWNAHLTRAAPAQPETSPGRPVRHPAPRRQPPPGPAAQAAAEREAQGALGAH